MPRTLTGRLAAALIIAVTLVAVTLSGVLARRDDLGDAKAATARFNSVQQAVAAGYALPPDGPLHECISAGNGAMGFHYINGGLLDDVLDPAAPEALVYAPDRNGKLKLVAVEYVIFQSVQPEQPELFGEGFMDMTVNPFGLPPFWALHAWIWKDNPDGTFEPFNSAVSC
jgi:hypothetical protein